MAYGLTLPINNSRILLGHGYSFVEKELYARFGYSYFFKNGLSFGVETNHPTKFSFEELNWTELNNLKETAIKTQFTFKVGYSPKIKIKNWSSAIFNERRGGFPSTDWYFRLYQSILYSGVGFYNKNGKLRLGMDVSSPLLYSVATYIKDNAYAFQIMDAALLTSIRFDAFCAYELPINETGFVTTFQAGLTSLWFNGTHIYVPAYYQSYSLTLGASFEYWVNERNGFFIEGNVPALSMYFNKGSKTPVLRTLVTDNNVKTVINYMTKVGYTHEIKSK